MIAILQCTEKRSSASRDRIARVLSPNRKLRRFRISPRPGGIDRFWIVDYVQLQGFMAAASMKRAGKLSDKEARAMVTA